MIKLEIEKLLATDDAIGNIPINSVIKAMDQDIVSLTSSIFFLSAEQRSAALNSCRYICAELLTDQANIVISKLAQLTQLLIKDPDNPTAKYAASKGEAYQAVTQELINVTLSQTALHRNTADYSTNQVFIGKNAVFKNAYHCAYIEEGLMESALAFFDESNEGQTPTVLPHSKIQTFSLGRRGIDLGPVLFKDQNGFQLDDGDLSLQDLKNAYDNSCLDDPGKNVIKSILAYSQLYNTYKASYDKHINSSIKYNQKLVSFGQFAELAFKMSHEEKFNINSTTTTLKKELVCNSDFAKALLFTTMPPPKCQGYFTIVSGDENLPFFTLKHCYIFNHDTKTWNPAKSKFQAVFALSIDRPVIWIDSAAPNLDSIPNFPEGKKANQNLIECSKKIKWSFYSSEISQINYNYSRFSEPPAPLFNTQHIGKIKCENMVRADFLIEKNLFDDVLDNVYEPEEKIKAIRMLYFQPLDLNGKNIGLFPKYTPSRYLDTNIRFEIDGKFVTLLQAHLKFIEGKINEGSSLTIYHNDRGKRVIIKDDDELLELFTAPWGFCHFDTDQNLYETNKCRQTIRGHMLPVLTELWATGFAFEPLDDKTIQKIKNDLGERERLFYYLNKKDHPLYLRLDKKQREEVWAIINEESLMYNFDSVYESKEDNPYEPRISFAKNLAKKESPLWAILETALNKNLDDQEKEKIAASIFPRATSNQQKALFERLNNLEGYLLIWEKLKEINVDLLTITELRQIALDIVSNECLPLSLTQREKLKQSLNDNKEKLYLGKILNHLQPSYQTIIHSLYPDMREIALLQSKIQKFNLPRTLESILKKHQCKQLLASGNPSIKYLFEMVNSSKEKN